MSRQNSSNEIPDFALREIVQLTKQATVENDDELRKRRAELARQFGFRVRVRRDEAARIVVLYPREWVEGGTVVIDRIDDIDRAIEIPLFTGQSDAKWEQIEQFNRRVVERVKDQYGGVHGENAATFADFVGNHLAKRISEVTQSEIDEFRSEYFVRNAWPSDRQEQEIERSLELIYSEVNQVE